MEFITYKPEEIETKSFEIISANLLEILGDKILDDKQAPIIKRVIHTTADFDYLESLYFSENSIDMAVEALKNGADIICDTNMVKSGINKTELAKLGGQVHCYIADLDVANKAIAQGTTRASMSMEKALKLEKPAIFAIGNAPTALIKLNELISQGLINPKLVIAVPVGFVNVVEAKELFVESDVPAIVSRGRKGGSNVAAAICNALLYSITNRKG